MAFTVFNLLSKSCASYSIYSLFDRSTIVKEPAIIKEIAVQSYLQLNVSPRSQTDRAMFTTMARGELAAASVKSSHGKIIK